MEIMVNGKFDNRGNTVFFLLKTVFDLVIKGDNILCVAIEVRFLDRKIPLAHIMQILRQRKKEKCVLVLFY